MGTRINAIRVKQNHLMMILVNSSTQEFGSSTRLQITL